MIDSGIQEERGTCEEEVFYNVELLSTRTFAKESVVKIKNGKWRQKDRLQEASRARERERKRERERERESGRGDF